MLQGVQTRLSSELSLLDELWGLFEMLLVLVCCLFVCCLCVYRSVCSADEPAGEP